MAFFTSTLASALAVGACGSSSSETPMNAPAVPDPRSRTDMRNDCSETTQKTLAANVADNNGDGPIARYRKNVPGAPVAEGWSPIVGETHDSLAMSSGGSRVWAGSSTTMPKPQCETLMPLFHRAAEGTGKDQIIYAIRLEHTVVDFPFPADIASAPAAGKPIAVKTTSRLHLDYLRALVRADGTVDPEGYITRGGEAQAWDIETTCEKPFMVMPQWERRNEMPEVGAQFCQKATGEKADCLVFALMYSADRCAMTLRNATLKLPSGGSVSVSLAGYFDINAPTDDGRPTGYSLNITNVELK